MKNNMGLPTLGAPAARTLSHQIADRLRQAILAETEGDIHFYDLDSGTECDRVSVAPGVNHVAMDPAGTRLAPPE